MDWFRLSCCCNAGISVCNHPRMLDPAGILVCNQTRIRDPAGVKGCKQPRMRDQRLV